MLFSVLALAALSYAAATRLHGGLEEINDMVIDDYALLMATSGAYGRAINGVSYQTQPLMTFAGFQYATWYHRGVTSGTIYLGRRKLPGNTWESFDTRIKIINGAGPFWDAHHIISMGISSEGKIHLAYDIHSNLLRYATSKDGAATYPTWNSSIMQPERSSLNKGDAPLDRVTYPRFVPIGKKQLLMTYRGGMSGNGNTFMTTYNSTSGQWGTPRKVIDGKFGNYSDDFSRALSTHRSAYLNGISRSQDGTLHVTWTWREAAFGANHDIMYACSKDGGRTWRNNEGLVIGKGGIPMHLKSPGVVVVTMGRRQSLMNQQSQAVDSEGSVHVLMWHRRFDETGYKWQPGDLPLYTADAAYYHYYRHPLIGTWTRTQLPTSENVGSRPQIVIDSKGNLFAVYTSPDVIPRNNSYYADGKLVIAGARHPTNGYAEWEILYKDNRRLYSGEPLVDQARLLNEDILSVFLQESSETQSATGSPLHVLEFKLQSHSPVAVETPKPATPKPAIPMFLILVLLAAFALSQPRKQVKKQ